MERYPGAGDGWVPLENVRTNEYPTHPSTVAYNNDRERYTTTTVRTLAAPAFNNDGWVPLQQLTTTPSYIHTNRRYHEPRKERSREARPAPSILPQETHTTTTRPQFTKKRERRNDK